MHPQLTPLFLSNLVPNGRQNCTVIARLTGTLGNLLQPILKDFFCTFYFNLRTVVSSYYVNFDDK